MKALYIVNFFPPSSGAAEVNTAHIVSKLARYGVVCVVVAPWRRVRSASHDLPSSLKVYEAGKSVPYFLSFSLSHLLNLAKIQELVRREGPFDIILVQYHPNHAASLVAEWAHRLVPQLPRLVRSHDVFPQHFDRPLPVKMYNALSYSVNRLLVHRSDVITGVTTEETRYLVDKFGCPPEKVFVNHNGVDMDQVRGAMSGQTTEPNTALYAGGLFPEDNVRSLVLAASQLRRIGVKDFVFYVYGYGPEREPLIALAEREGVDPNVKFMNPIPHGQLLRKLASCQVGIGPLGWGFFHAAPTKALEPMSMGLPLVSSRLSSDLGKHLKTYYVVQDRDVSGLATAMHQLFTDDTLRKRLGAGGTSLVRREYDWSVTVGRLKELMDRAAG